ncbi:MAG: hypothetical protein ACE5HB_08150 [Terriglobia bacterium]
MWFELFLAALIMAAGSITFGHFEEKTPVWRRLLKLALVVGMTGLLASAAGRFWALLFLLGMAGIGLTFHLWWCRKHGIHPLRAEPRAKYHALRGWR